MRVSDLRRPALSPAATPARRAQSGGGAFEVTPSGPRETASVRAAAPLSGIDALVTLQAVEDGQDSAESAKRQGREVLDLLDQLKLALLSGELSRAQLARLERAVARPAPGVDDPRLKDVLDQIDLRARVELAKLGRRAA